VDVVVWPGMRYQPRVPMVTVMLFDYKIVVAPKRPCVNGGPRCIAGKVLTLVVE